MSTMRAFINTVITEKLSKPDGLAAFRDDPAMTASRHGPIGREWESKLSQLMAERGFFEIGSGAASMVFANVDYPWALKIFNQDQGYLEWLAFCNTHHDNPYCPRFRGQPTKISGAVYMLRLEKLRPVETQMDKEAYFDLRQALGDPLETRDKYLQEIMDFLGNYEGRGNNNIRLDWHIGNVMFRGKQIVITDPLYQMSA